MANADHTLLENVTKNVYMTILRDVLQPILVVAISSIGGWFMIDHINLRSEVEVMRNIVQNQKEMIDIAQKRLHALEDLSLKTANNRFTDADGQNLESRITADLDRVEARLDRVEERVNKALDNKE